MSWCEKQLTELLRSSHTKLSVPRMVRGKVSAREETEPVKLAKPKAARQPRGPYERIPACDRRPEWRVLKGCIDLLSAHPCVAFYWRQNTGSFQVGGRYLKFSFRGASDLMAVMKRTGQFWAIECKSTGKKATKEQQAFLDAVNAAGGVGICVDDPEKLAEELNRAMVRETLRLPKSERFEELL